MDTAPLVDPLGRCAKLLQIYDCDEVWLRIDALYEFTCPDAQVHVTVTDARGRPLGQVGDCQPAQTFRLAPTFAAVRCGERLRVYREGDQIQVAWGREPWNQPVLPDMRVADSAPV